MTLGDELRTWVSKKGSFSEPLFTNLVDNQNKKEMDIQDKVAVVTGVSKGIGLELLKQFLDKGAVVAGWGRTCPDFQNDRFHFVQCDVGNEQSIQNAAKVTLEKLGPVSVLVNNAGFGVYGNFEDQSWSDWKAMFDVNVLGLFEVTRNLVGSMKSLGEAHIVNISSIAGLNGVKGFSGYVGTKHAVRGLSHSWFQELREFGIKVTTVYPGSVNTNFFDDIDVVEANENMMRPQDVANSIVQLIETHHNYLPVDLEIRPLKPKG